ncbi:MAG: hypothetical protein ACXVB0_06370 [Mucilaginibacter sp.]
MDNSFLAYLQKLELLAFFSGYPLIYALTFFVAGNLPVKSDVRSRITSLLPFAYALVGTLFLGFELKKLYPDYSLEHIKLTIQQPWLIIWALSAMLFWIPALGKRISLSLIHSLVFFFFIVRDLFYQIFSSTADSNIIANDMKVYIFSLLMNLGALVVLVLISFLFSYYRKRI